METIPYPTLFVHHRDDGCHATPYSTARHHYELITSIPRKDFVTVTGGDPPISRPCRALSKHGFLEKERKVVQAMTNWASGITIPLKIGP